MQQTGTLKKRRRRNIAKVTGLSTLNYNAEEDIFDGMTLFESRHRAQIVGNETRLRMSSLLLRSQSRTNSRITRDATFHMEPDEDGAKDNFEEQSVPGASTFLSSVSVKDRPYFLDKWTMSRLRQIFILGAFSGTFPWSWNGKKHRIDKWSPGWERLWNIQWGIVTLQTCFMTVYQVYAFHKGIVEGHHETYRELFMSSFSVFWYCICLCFNVTMVFYKDQIREFINTLFKFNKEYMDKYVLDLDDYQDGGRIVINLSIPSNTCQVFVSVSLFLRMPFQPWYLFSYIYPKPWYWLIPGAMQEFIVVGQVIANYTLYQWVVVAHANSMEFWLRESHRNADSGYTTDEMRHPKTAIETYRTLQIVTQCFNDCMAPMAMPTMKMCIVGALIPCGYVFIRSMNHKFIDEFPGILTYPVGIIDCATTGFSTLTLAATVFDLGCGFVDSWSRTKHKSFRRILMSCPTLKVKVARFYFVTVATTITFFKVVWDYIIDCIITFP
ncbi:unnamed protein product [Orchesella dallaii]|uniref:Gustatory receptor n=1 Tax=Orchesella dallaii TaxID=48710 RepID=A0ABP1PK57_9HEXA